MSDKAGWYRWQEVTQYVLQGHRLFRASAPNYDEHKGDNSQNLTADSVRFLASQGITGVISFNHNPYTAAQIALLTASKIKYLHLPVEDFHPPSYEQLLSAIEFYRSLGNNATLIHCGYGHGRTGTGVTAVQLSSTGGQSPPQSQWKSVNHVETDPQVESLLRIQSHFRGA
ncbi:hypothetical protein NLI96_g1212 [Meripilus lineatus]|uniref:Tyrosine specific protein phosphatases domain-containing protein n=1 Tax=Meripilus lineatus TaxID=2056292 RepID=A0AAD5YLA5_9APHY|nr:hypothetical protein NLI96_g1212 [Physisporinus lineatus]